MPNPTPSIVKTFALLLLCAVAMGADGPARRFDCGSEPAVTVSEARGRLLILPGVGNTRFHLAGFVAAAEAQLPRFDVEVRTWGVPFLTIHNLRAHERNTATAAAIAAEIAQWRRANPDAPFYLVGYSGGGGMATLVTAALPEDVQKLADKSYELLKVDPKHPSLHFKKLGKVWSARVGLHYRAVATEVDDGMLWFWIGTHADYDKLIG